MQDPNPGLDSTSEEVDVLELEPKVEEQNAQGGDPLDEISDLEARAEAKKNRAIARRIGKKETVETKVEPVLPSTEFVTKADFQKTNERTAVKQATADPEVKANWKEIIPFYTPRRGKDTPEDISEDIKDAVTLWKARNATVEPDDSAKILTQDAVAKTGGGVVEKTEKKLPDPPGFSLPVQPGEWYPKKESK